jgi:hypothetical protein
MKPELDRRLRLATLDRPGITGLLKDKKAKTLDLISVLSNSKFNADDLSTLERNFDYRWKNGASGSNARLQQAIEEKRRLLAKAPLKMATGGMVPGTGNRDTVPALLTPGESVITKEATQKYAPILHQMNKGTLPGFNEGMINSQSKKSYSGKIPTLQMIDALPEGPMKRKYLREFSIAYKASLAAAKETGSLVQVDKAHLESSPPGRVKDFSAEMWTPQAGVENQFTSLMQEKQLDPTRLNDEKYVKNIESQNKAAEKKRAVFEKSLLEVSGKNGEHTEETAKLMKDLKRGAALDHKQLVMQTKALEYQAVNTEALVRSGLSEDVQKKYLARSAEVAAAGRSRMQSVNMTDIEASQLRAQYRASGIEDEVRGRPSTVPTASDAAEERMRRKIENSKTSRQRQEAGKQRKIDAQEKAKSQSAASAEAAAARAEERNTTSRRRSLMGRGGRGFGGVAGGLSMTMGMASMLPMMAADEQGKFMGMDSNTAMMGMMGGSAILGILPMLGKAALPIAGVLAGLTLAGATIWKLSDEWNKTTHAVSDFRDKLYGSSDLITNVAKELGRETAAQTSGMYNALTTSNVTQESMQFGQQFMDTESGKKMLQDMKDFSKQGGNVADALKNNLTKMIVSGIMTPEEAQSVAIQMGTQLNNQTLAMNVNAKINEIVGPNGEKMKNNVVDVIGKISPVLDEKQLDKQVNAFYAQRSSFAGGGIGQFFSGLTTALRGEEYTKAQMKIEAYSNAVVQSAELERQARSQVNLAFREGTITVEEYNRQISQLGSSSIASKSFEQLREGLEQAFPKTNIPTTNAIRSKPGDPGYNQFDVNSAANAFRSTGGGLPGQATPQQANIPLFGQQNQKDSMLMQQSIDNVTRAWTLFTDQVSMSEDVKGRIEGIADATSMVGGQVDKLSRAKFLVDVASGAISQNVLQSLMYLPDDQVATLSKAEGGLKGLSDQLGIISEYPALTQRIIDIKINKPDEFNKNITSIKSNVMDILSLPPDFQKTFGINLDTASDADLSRFAEIANSVDEQWPLLAKLDPAIDKRLFIETNILANGKNLSPRELGDLIRKTNKAMEDLSSKNNNIVKKAVIDIVTSTNGATAGKDAWSYINKNIKDFNKFELQDKMAIITIVTKYETLDISGRISRANASEQSGTMTAREASARRASAGFDQNLIDIEAANAAEAARISMGEKEKGGSGGEKQLSFLEQLTKDTDANMKIFPAMVAKVKKKFPGIPQSILDAMGTGPEGLKNFEEVLKANADKVRKLFTRYRKTAFNQTLEEMQNEITATQKKTNVANKIQDLPEEVKAIIMANDGLIEQISVVKQGSPTYNQAIAQAREMADAQRDLENSTKSASIRLSENLDILDAALSQQELEIRNKNAAEFLATNGKTTEEMQRQVDSNQRLIDAQQDLVNKKQDQIEALNRESEIRNRIADGLSRELDLMSKQEQDVRDTYQKRIDALDKIASINQHIIDQQSQQLSFAQALSAGDVGAAVKAQQDMQNSNSQYATGQMRAGLQTGMQNQISALTTSGGLTRKQAENQIAAIQQQSYQTGLKIRDIEDEVYKIQIEKIKPLVDQNALYTKKLQYNQQDLDWQLATDLFQGKSREYWIDFLSDTRTAKSNLEAMKLPLTQLREEMEALAAAASRVNVSTGGSSSIPTTTSAGQSFSGMSGAQINNLTGSDIGRYLKWSGGGMGLNLAGYSAGGQVGMDSVPAMLTPGEFVMRKSSVDKYGKAMLSSMNIGAFNMPKYNVKDMSTPDVTITPISTSTNVSAPVYNTYSVNVNVPNSNASADDIANKVMMKIKNTNNMAVRNINGY